jgi:hypothetical protein
VEGGGLEEGEGVEGGGLEEESDSMSCRVVWQARRNCIGKE